MILTPSNKQWKTIKQLWSNIKYEKLSDAQTSNFLQFFNLHNGFGHPKEYVEEIASFVRDGSDLSLETANYIKTLEPVVERFLGDIDGVR
jgi:hypothetical protein